MNATDLLAEAQRLGYIPNPTANGHLAFRHPSGALVHVSRTPSCHRALRNARADLRRELRIRGVTIEVEVRKLPPKGGRARARLTPPAAKPSPPLAGAFHPTGQHGRLAGHVGGRGAVLELRHGPEGPWLAMRWASEGTGGAP